LGACGGNEVMKYLVLFLFSSSLLFAQKKKSRYTKESFDVIYVQKFLSKSTLNGALNSQSNFSIAKPLSFIGIGTTGRYVLTRGNYQYTGHIYYTQVIPQKLQLNDSTSAIINGFNFAASVWGFDVIPKKQNIDLIISAGFNTGRLRLFIDKNTRQKNPFVSPNISITPRFIFGKLCFLIRAEYDIDVSSKNWRSSNFSETKHFPISQYSNTGFSLSACIGITLQ
jgi:hypothetical protein